MSRNLLLGLLAALLAALIGTGWQLVSRHGVTTSLGPIELAVLRYGLPALMLSPCLRGLGLLPAGVPRLVLLLLVAGGGLPFGLLVLSGAQFAPAAHIGVFLSGAMPLFAALLAWRVEGERFNALRKAGLLLVALGVAILGSAGWGNASWRGDLLFLLAALAWAVYTLAFRRSGLTPWQGAALVNAWSALLLLLVLPWLGAPRLLTAPWPDLAFQVVWQGGIAGVLGLVTYTAAVVRLGAARAALSSALVPPMTALGAFWVLGEPLAASSGLAVALVAWGVAVAGLSGMARRA
ncbi:EamA family transporter [uncultured Ramlibacter sp.]|uniref:EamA family transporter n=1 Tax=uncultured Ramlibacter sp. TaxID=260755 RepID=UPI002634B96F|nr:EamA family transporter [uncultured Ramlibacter sp.]